MLTLSLLHTLGQTCAGAGWYIVEREDSEVRNSVEGRKEDTETVSVSQLSAFSSLSPRGLLTLTQITGGAAAALLESYSCYHRTGAASGDPLSVFLSF